MRLTIRLRALVWVAALLLLGGCAVIPEPPARGGATLSDLELTWAAGRMVWPAADGKAGPVRRIGEVSDAVPAAGEGRRWPVVVYLHGCTGLGVADFTFMRRLARAGMVVIAPDSMARRYRPWQCDPKTRTGGYNLFVYDFRQAEINYALQRLAALDWVDRDNLFLVGASEGGVAAALYRGSAFRARVIAQWTCHGSALVRGLAGPPGVPVLSIVRHDDPWYDQKHTRDQQGDCGVFFGQRPGSKSLVLARGTGHDVLGNKAAIKAIVAFLQANRTQ